MYSIDYSLKGKNRGHVLVVAVIFLLLISVLIIGAMVTPSIRDYYSVKGLFYSKKSFFLSESGVEDAYYRLKEGITIDSQANLSIGSDTVVVDITDSGFSQKSISSVATADSRIRKNQVFITTGSGVSFNYGVQVGQGGLYMEGSSGIIGNVYANGPIYGESSTYVLGTAISANAPAGYSDQSNGTGVPSHNLIFAKENNYQDIAQSFEVSSDDPINKFSFYLKKIGNPSNITVRLVMDDDGSPGGVVLAEGTLSASTVTTDYGWVDVSLSSNPKLSPGVTYWVVLDTSASSSKYYIIGASDATYNYGEAQIGKYSNLSWSATNPSYADLYFQVYLGGMTGLIQGVSQWNQIDIGVSSSDSAQAHTVNNVYSTGDIFCKVGSGNNTSCLDQADPVYRDFPISEGNILAWQDQASSDGVINGDYVHPGEGIQYLGPKHITGNLSVGGSGTLVLTGPLWVEGDVLVSGLGKIVLDDSYGENSEVIIAEGTVANSGSGKFEGSGMPGSYVLVITTSNCDQSICGGKDAIEITGAADSVVLYAPNGTVRFEGSAQAREAIGYKVVLSGSSTITYDSGLVDINFSSGPSGSWEINQWAELIE